MGGSYLENIIETITMAIIKKGTDVVKNEIQTGEIDFMHIFEESLSNTMTSTKKKFRILRDGLLLYCIKKNIINPRTKKTSEKTQVTSSLIDFSACKKIIQSNKNLAKQYLTEIMYLIKKILDNKNL
uniref:Uncharacterized protein n=1 Tax=viral metagenome TaxID=1070528 RepID=A0A6C0B9Z9_9ZZZZ